MDESSARKPDISAAGQESGSKSRFGRVKMNTVQVTLSMYYKIVGADLYDGPERRYTPKRASTSIWLRTAYTSGSRSDRSWGI